MKAESKFGATTQREIRISDFESPLECLRAALGPLVLTAAAALIAGASEPTTNSSAPFSGSNSLPASVLLDKNAAGRVQTVVAQALREPQVDKRLQRLSELSASLSLSEIPEALKAADGLDELRDCIVLKQTALGRWGELSPADAFAYLVRFPESQWKANTLRDIAAKFAAQDIDHAAAAAAAMSAGASRNDTITLVANVWAQANVAAALAWAEKLQPGFAKASALDAIRYVWVHSDPVAASSHVEKLPGGTTRNNLVANIAFEWTARDQPAALRWANHLPEGPDKDTALSNVAESWANRDPQAAAVFALKLSSGKLRAQAGAMVAARWARQHPRAAADWVWNCGDTGIQQRGLKEVFGIWAGVNPSECAEWLEHLSPGANRDRAVRAFVSATTVWTPDLATRDSLLIENELLRTDALNESFPRCMEVARNAAAVWLSHVTMSES